MPERVVALQLLSSYWLAVILPPTLCFSAIYNERTSAASSPYSPYSHHQSRKFGGYKIFPKPCKDATSPEKEAGGVCMFNYECTQRSGTVVGSCMDGFLYGTCCKLPAGMSISTFGMQETTASRPYTSSASDRSTTILRPHIEHSPQETFLLYKNGTVVQNVNSPEEFLFISKQQAQAIPQTSPLPAAFNDDRLPPSSGTPSPKPPSPANQLHHGPPSHTFGDSVVHTKPDRIPTFNTISNPYSPKPYTTASSREPFSPDFSTTKFATTKSSPHTGTSKTTDYFSQSSKFNFAASTSYTPTMIPAAIMTNKNDYEGDENLIRVPTLTADGPHKYGTNTSISHILWLLNDTKTEVVTEEATTPTTQSFYTWLSIQNNADKGDSPYFSTKPVHQQYTSSYDTKPSTALPSTTVHHIPGPSFHVTPEVKITPKPQGGVSESAPTVIVLSSPQDTASPPRKPTLGSYTTTASYNVSYHYPSVSSTLKPLIKPVSSYSPTTEKPIYSSILITAKPSGSSVRPVSSYNTRPVAADTKPSSGSIYTAFPVTSVQPTTKPIKSATATTATTATHITSSVQTFTKIKPITITASSSTTTLPPPFMQTTLVTTAKPIIWGNHLDSDSIIKPTYGQSPIPTYSNGYPITSSSSFVSVRPAVTAQAVYHDPSTFAVYPPSHLMANATENIFDFPPVRDPHVNLTATYHDKPMITSTTTFGDEDTDSEVTPPFMVDKTLEDKMHVFVEKIVQSLQGNFEDLEKVLVVGESTNNVTVNTGGPQKKPTAPTKRPPTKKPNTKPTTRPQKPAITTLPVTTPVVTKKPSKKPSLATPVVLFQPSSTSQNTIAAPNKKPIKVTTTISISPSSTSMVSSAPENEDESGTTNKIGDLSEEPVDYKKECGVRPMARKKGRIVGGKGSSFGEWPWQVLVREATWLGLFTKNKCGGVLITEKYVITAAHCQPGFLANLVAVFGEFDISGEVESKRSISKNVRRVIVHRQYDAATFENDIALLELESPIQFDTHIVPICMPEDNDDFTGRMATVTGWGRLKYGGGVPSVLQEVQVPVLDNAVCQHMFHTAGHPKVILSSFLCAGYANGQRDSCEGDSGGPLMMERSDGHWTLVATVSHGIKCAAPYLPGVYMRTTYYKPWLQTITGV